MEIWTTHYKSIHFFHVLFSGFMGDTLGHPNYLHNMTSKHEHHISSISPAQVSQMLQGIRDTWYICV